MGNTDDNKDTKPKEINNELNNEIPLECPKFYGGNWIENWEYMRTEYPKGKKLVLNIL
jgi:hypothetical protein